MELVCTWSGDFITDGSSNSAAHINRVYNREYIIALDELDNVDAIIDALDEKEERRMKKRRWEQKTTQSCISFIEIPFKITN